MSDLFSDKTYENLLAEALARIEPSFDKREGSMVYNGVAPAMAELAQLYIELGFVFEATHIATAPRDYLIMKASERGLAPYPASAAVIKGVFNTDVPIGSRFSCDKLNFYVTEKMSDQSDGAQSYRLVCETPGSLANASSGDLIPIEYISGLSSASIAEILIPGDDEEDTEAFKQRVLDSFQVQTFGGNQADYKEKIRSMPGVGGVKVHPVWNSDTPPSSLIPGESVQTWFTSGMQGVGNDTVKEWITAVYNAAANKKLTVGGSVELVVMTSGYTAPTAVFLDEIQTAVDPTQNAGEGLGIAPIGHVIKVVGVTQESINIGLNLTFITGWDWTSAKSYIEATIDKYFSSLAVGWENSEHLIVRISQIESRILSECSAMIDDISGTKINGKEQNLTLDSDSIPVRGTITNG